MQKVTIDLIDDLDGITPAVETFQFGVEGAWYQIDLSADNLAEFRGYLDKYLSVARRAGRPAARTTGQPSRRVRPKTDPAQLAAMREWGKANGYEVSDKGRVPQAVQEAFHADAAKPKRSRRAAASQA